MPQVMPPSPPGAVVDMSKSGAAASPRSSGLPHAQATSASIRTSERTLHIEEAPQGHGGDADADERDIDEAEERQLPQQAPPRLREHVARGEPGPHQQRQG